MRFTITVAGEVQMDREVEAIGAHADKLDTVLHDIAGDLRKVIARQFETEGAYGSGGWPRLTEDYRKRKARMVAQGRIINGRPARHMQILRLTDRLRKSAVDQHDPEHIESVVNHTLRFGTSVPYARFHQRPGAGGGGKRRPILDLPETKRQEYARGLLTFLRTGQSGIGSHR